MHKLLAVLLFFGAVFSGISCSKKSDDRSRPLVVGMELNFPPFEMKDPSGKPTGISVEMAEALGKFVQREIRIEDMPFDALIPSLKTGKIDLAISSMTITVERGKSIDFSEPYLNTGISILAGAATGIRNVSDLDQPGRKVAVKKGTTGHIYATDHFKQAQILTFDSSSGAVVEVIQGKADAFIYDEMSVFKYYRQNPKTTHAILQPFQKEGWGIGVRKGNDELRQEVNAFLADFKAKNGFNVLGDKYLGEEKKAFQEMGFPFYF
ncbi:MAG TPA: transporter substrate-binding domain-containing protein [Chthoniobacterales bacterium]